MRDVWTVARREIRSYFDHPTAYILVIAFLVLGLFLAFRTILAQRVATLRPLFDLVPWLFAVFVPAMTMRSVAEERRGHTLEWLLAHPLTETEVVAGKFIGDWIFVLFALAATLPAAFGILLASEADPGIIVAQYAGAALLAAEMVAIGVWASSVTRNQITAFILGAGVSFLLVLIGTRVVQIGLPPAIGGAAARLGVVSHFENVARGVIDLRDIIYFLSMSALFLMLAVVAVARERLSRARGAYRRLRLGALAVAALVIVVNLLGGYLRGRLDLTRGNVYTLADGSRQIVGNLKDVVNAKLFVSSELPPEVQLNLRDVRDLLADLARASDGDLRVEELNPDEDTAASEEASTLGIQPIDFNVVRESEFQVKRGWFGLALTYADRHKIIPVIDRTDDLEYRIVSDIASMTATHKPRIAFATGFGAHGPYDYSVFQQAIADRYDVRSVPLQTDSASAAPALSRDSTDVVVVAGPKQTLDAKAADALASFVDHGGAAFLMLETTQINPQYPVGMSVDPGVSRLLEEHGVKLDQGMVYDLRSHANVTMGRQGMFSLVRGYPLWPIALRAGDHITTRDLQNLSLGWAGAFTIQDTARAKPLWTTSDAGGLRPSQAPIQPAAFGTVPADSLHTEVLAVAIAPPASKAEDDTTGAGGGGRMIAIADADFLSDNFVNSNPQNLVFAANAIDWLAQDDALIAIRSRQRTPPALVFSSDFQQGLLKWGSLIGVPVLLVLIALVRIGGRKRRATRWWNDAAPAAWQPGARTGVATQ